MCKNNEQLTQVFLLNSQDITARKKNSSFSNASSVEKYWKQAQRTLCWSGRKCQLLQNALTELQLLLKRRDWEGNLSCIPLFLVPFTSVLPPQPLTDKRRVCFSPYGLLAYCPLNQHCFCQPTLSIPCCNTETYRASPAVQPLSSRWGAAQKANVSVSITHPYLNDLLCYLPGFVNIQGYLGVPYKRVKRSSFAEATGKRNNHLENIFKILEENKNVTLDVQLVFLFCWQNPSTPPPLRSAILKNFRDPTDLHLCGCTHVREAYCYSMLKDMQQTFMYFFRDTAVVILLWHLRASFQNSSTSFCCWFYWSLKQETSTGNWKCPSTSRPDYENSVPLALNSARTWTSQKAVIWGLNDPHLN